MPPNYELRDFWEDRFKTESHFEWLGDGQDTLLPVLRTHLQNPPAPYDSSHPPRILHIGAGTSTFSDSIVEEYRKIYGANAASEVIVNVDFAQEAVDRGRERAKERGHTEVSWEQVDLLDLNDILALRASVFRARLEERFEVVLDKSTSDAISCGEDIVWDRTKLERYPQRLHPFVVDALSALPKVVVVLRRMDILAVHLALLVRPGGLWVVLSYSKFRFQHLQDPSEADLEERIDMGRLWRLAGVVPVTAPSGRADDEAQKVHMPEISHYLYVLRRTDVAVE